MAETRAGLKFLNPYAPEFFPQNLLPSLFAPARTQIISFYASPPPPPQPLNPNQYYSFYFSLFHQTSTSNSCTPSNFYPNIPFPTQAQYPQTFGQPQPSAEPTLSLPLQVPHDEEQQQQQIHQIHGGGFNQPQSPRERVYRSTCGYKENTKRRSFGLVRSSSSTSTDGENKVGNKKRQWRGKLGFSKYKGTFSNNNYRKYENYPRNYWSAPKKMAAKKCSDVLPVERDGSNTTVMIRNIPNKYTRELLMNFIDTHCALENFERGGDGSAESALVSAYDFLYLPIDFQTGFNKGYAFVNFTNAKAVWKFYLAAHCQAWDLFQSTKIREIVYAKIQGKKELVEHFETMGFPCETEDVLPVCFDPPRDGSRSWVLQTTVGNPILSKSNRQGRRQSQRD